MAIGANIAHMGQINIGIGPTGLIQHAFCNYARRRKATIRRAKNAPHTGIFLDRKKAGFFANKARHHAYALPLKGARHCTDAHAPIPFERLCARRHKQNLDVAGREYVSSRRDVDGGEGRVRGAKGTALDGALDMARETAGARDD